MTTVERCPDCGRQVDGVCVDCHFANGSWSPRRTELSGLSVKADHTVEREEVNYHQDQDHDEDQDHDQDYHPPSTALGLGGKAEPSDLEIAIAEHRNGKLTPVHVELGPMPDVAGPVMRAIAEHMRLLMGLRAATGEYRPLPYACSLAVNAGLAPDKGTASKAIRSLVKFGVVRFAGTLKPQGKPNGVKLYAPPFVDNTSGEA